MCDIKLLIDMNEEKTRQTWLISLFCRNIPTTHMLAQNAVKLGPGAYNNSLGSDSRNVSRRLWLADPNLINQSELKSHKNGDKPSR